MKVASHTVTVSAPAQVVWSKLVHWQKWPTWDTGMERITFDGPIDVGSIGRLKLKDGPEVQLHVSSLIEGESYEDYFDVFGTRFIFYHDLRTLEDGLVELYFSVEATGLTALFLGNLKRAELAQHLPKWMEYFKQQCET
jgi:hypothetical protein